MFLGKTLHSEIASLPRCINDLMLEINPALGISAGVDGSFAISVVPVLYFS